MLKNKLKGYSDALRKQGLHRKRHVLSRTCETLLFNSNDYLSLTQHKDIKAAYLAGVQKFPTGSGGSMLVCGYHQVHKTLEDAFSTMLGVDDALLFSSGYAANLSLVRMLAQLNAHLFIDKSVHASIYDGLQGVGVPFTRYLHNDVSDLSKKIDGVRDGVVITESIFSMSGQIAPLAEIALLDSALLVDEAHAFGVVGNGGLGGVIAAQLTQLEVPLRVIPLGKAIGGVGAVIAGDAVWIDALLQTARSYIYSTAMSPAIAYGVLKTLEFTYKADYRRHKLSQLVQYFREKAHQSVLCFSESFTPIQQLQLGCPHLSMVFENHLKSRGILCSAMRQPTVSKKETGLRIILNYDHEPEDIDYLFKSLHEYTFS